MQRRELSIFPVPPLKIQFKTKRFENAGEEKRCWSERRLAQRTARRHNETRNVSGRKSHNGETFIPECNEDGRFAEIQVKKNVLSTHPFSLQ